MTALMIPDIAQLKLAEITALTDAVATARRAVESRQAAIESLTARAKHFQDRLGRAEAARATALDHLNRARSARSAADGLAAACLDSHRLAAAMDDALDAVAAAELELVRRLVGVASLLDKAGHLANRRKASNPQIPDALVELLGTASGDCANVLALALVAQGACLTAGAGLSDTRGCLELARSRAGSLRHRLQPGPHDEQSVLDHLESDYRRSDQRHAAELAASVNATAQLDHATAALATAKAKLVSLQAGLAAVMAGAG